MTQPNPLKTKILDPLPTQPNPTQSNPTHGSTQPMDNSGYNASLVQAITQLQSRTPEHTVDLSFPVDVQFILETVY